MMTASVEEQRHLLDIQELDTRLAQLAHQRRTHPTLATLEELQGRADDLQRAHTQAEAAAADARRELLKAEADVDQVRSRTERGQEKLSSGNATARELQNITSELEALQRRREVLEEAQLEQMEIVEQLEDDLEAIGASLSAITAQIEEVTQERDEVFAQLDEERDSVAASRARLAEGIPAALLDLYESVRARTGGLAAVPLRGEATVGINVPLSLTEKAAIKAAPPEQIIQSEEYDYLLIRVED